VNNKNIHDKFVRGFRPKDAYVDQHMLLPDAKVIFDIGANQGQTSRRYRALFQSAQIHAFEPFAEAYDVLARQFRGDSHAICVQQALGAAPERRQLHVYEASVINSLMPFVREAGGFVPMDTSLKKTLDVNVTTLDDYCAVNAIENIDILKMDTQGAELDILCGAKRMLSEGRISIIFSEHIFVPVYDGQAEFHEVLLELARAGFALFDFYSFVYAPSGQVKWGDALYRRCEHAKKARDA